MSAIIVYKLDDRGQEVWQYPATVLYRQADCIRLEAFFNRDDLDLGFAVFKRGDRFIEYFFADRWYNVFAIYDREDDRLKGWYCNVCRPAVLAETAVRCEDLALDLWAGTEGYHQVLDEDEFAALPLDDREREMALQALAELSSLAAAGKLPR